MSDMPNEERLFRNRAKKLLSRVAEVENKLIGLLICATAAYDWLAFCSAIGQAKSYYSHGIYMLSSLSIVSVFFSSVYLTCAGIILLTSERPQARYKSVVPNLVSILAALAPYLFVLAPSGTLLSINIYFAYSLIVGGTFVMLASLFFLRRAFSVTPQARSLVTTGPYSIVRHPIYCSNILSLLGLALLIDSMQSVTLFVVCSFLQMWRARYEEKLLDANFPEYAVYRNRVGRFLPRLRFSCAAPQRVKFWLGHYEASFDLLLDCAR